MFQDKYIACRDCGSEFLFSVSEQEFYAEKGFENEPARCPACRQVRKQGRNDGGGGFRPRDNNRQQFPATCATCGKETTVPFEPTAGKPVYCRDCFQQRR